ncbi:hypothetical protein SAMN04487931_104348 [Desulfobacula phenolica]|uniref:Uncharacterized protein n=1 Tax=Desulfobacula phenolica TaxID=90732 RepID=A0A1H2FUE5_9BACT|nr:hypothetical protein SAMN04487931_104348 [Desulfobacula phenolica]
MINTVNHKIYLTNRHIYDQAVKNLSLENINSDLFIPFFAYCEKKFTIHELFSTIESCFLINSYN